MTAGRRWFAMGDPQTTFAKVQAVLEQHRLLGPDGRLRSDVGLVSMGDHFDFGAKPEVDRAERSSAGLEGCRVLEWFAEHPRDQLKALVGNHDLARVQELASVDDATFGAARDAAASLRQLRGAERVEATRAFHARYPAIPTPDLACRDFSTFLEAQRTLVQRLLAEERFDCVVPGRLHGEPCLLSHTGVTQRELRRLDLAEERSVDVLARKFTGWFRERVARVADAWARGEHAALDLDPLHLPGQAPLESGGWFAFRPANPDRPDIEESSWEWSDERPRRFDPRTVPKGLLQVVGHTRHSKLARELVPWVSADVETGCEHGLRTLTVTEEAVRYEGGVGRLEPGTAVMVFTDVDLHEAPVEAAALLELDGVG